MQSDRLRAMRLLDESMPTPSRSRSSPIVCTRLACPTPICSFAPRVNVRLSNFLLWQLAYTEIYVTDTYWPDFREPELDAALVAYAGRRRRFGKTDAQIDKD